MRISPQAVSMNYNRSPSLGRTLDTPSQAPAVSVSCCHLDVDNERAADITVLSHDTVDEVQRRTRLLTNNENLSAAQIIDSCTSTSPGITSLPQRKAASSDEQKYLATSPNISVKLSPNLLRHDELLSFEALTACRQRQLSIKQTPSSDVDQLSDSDSCSDVWVPRTSSASEGVSGIWIVCGQATTADILPAARPPTPWQLQCAYKLRAELESPDPVFRRRVASGISYPTRCCGEGVMNFSGRSSETVNRRLTAQDRRQAWQTAALHCRTRYVHSDFTLLQDNISQLASSRRSVVPATRTRRLSAADAGIDDGQETPGLMADGCPRAETNIDEAEDRQQRTKDSRNIEQLLHLPVSATATTAALASSLLQKLTSLRHGRSSEHDDSHKQQKLIENRARKALRTISITH